MRHGITSGIVSGREALKLSILKSLLEALNFAKTICDHGMLVIELDNSYIEQRIQGRGRAGNAIKAVSPDDPAYSLFYQCIRVIEQCDAQVSTALVKRTQAYRHLLHMDTIVEPDVLTIDSAFSDLD